MPELPEVEMVARLIGGAVHGTKVEAVRVGAINTLKSFDPPVSSLSGACIEAVRRRGKHLIIDFDAGVCMLIHLMSAGRLQLLEEPASRSDRRSRFELNLADGRHLRLREFGTRQSSWVKLLWTDRLHEEETLATLGPEAWPEPPAFEGVLSQPRPLHALLRDQRVIAGIGRSWADEILHRAMLSPFKKGDDLTAGQAVHLRSGTIAVLGEAIGHYEQALSLPLPDKFPMPLKVHRRTGLPCPRCDARLQAVYFEDHEMTYCPVCQTGGKLLKDRRLSRLLR